MRLVSRARLRARWDVGALATAAVCAALIACGGAHKPKGRPAELRAVVEPPTAIVQVDEKFVGSARVLDKRPAQLAPGKHRVTVEAEGYFPHDVEVDLVPGVTTLQLKLRAVPP
jgi:hypothetical protein